MAADVAPGLQRMAHALPTRWLGFDAARWHALVDEAQARERRRPRSRCARRSSAAMPIRTRSAPRASNADRGRRRATLDLRLDARDVGASAAARPLDARPGRLQSALRRAPGRRSRAVSRARRCARSAPRRSGARACCAAMPNSRYATGLRANKKYQLFNGAHRMHADRLRPDRAAAARTAEAPRRCRPKARRWSPTACARTCASSRPGASAKASTCYRAYDADLPEYAAAIDVYQPERRRRERMAARAGIRGARRNPGSDHAPAPQRTAGRRARSVRSAARTHRAEDARARQGRQQVRTQLSIDSAANSWSCAKATRACA